MNDLTTGYAVFHGTGAQGMSQDVFTEASISVAEDGDVLITILKGSNMSLKDEVQISTQGDTIVIEQNKKKYGKIKIEDESFIDAVKKAPNIIVVECDDDGFEVFEKTVRASKPRDFFNAATPT